MPGPTFMSGEHVALHTVEEEDLDHYARAHADPDIRVPLTIDDVENRDRLEERFEEDISDDESVHFMACIDRDLAVDSAGQEVVDRQLASGEDDEGEAAESDDTPNDDAPNDDATKNDDPVPVGSVIFPTVDEADGTASLAYWILPEYQGHGFGSEAVSLLLEYGFDELRLHRAQAHCLATNDGSIGLLESLGFEVEGRIRERQFLDGEYVDVLRFGLLEDEWRDT